MTSLYLPEPKNVGGLSENSKLRPRSVTNPKSSTTPKQQGTTNQNAATNSCKTYEHRCQASLEFSKLSPAQRQARKGTMFVPRSIRDFEDGGAFPEIHVAQYPRNMGNPHLNRGGAGAKSGDNNGKGSGGGGGRMKMGADGSSVSTTRAIVNVQINADGSKDFTSLVKGGTNKGTKVYAKYSDLKGYKPTEAELALPTEEETRSTTEKTALALQNIISDKVAMLKPSGSAIQNAATSRNQEEKTQFVQYTPNPNAPGYNPAAAKRVIQMVPAQLDPMMPPKHKHTKAPRGPADDFVPVLHSAPEKLTKEEKEAWNIPACISNWKNTRGYTIPLDKRLAADGRGLRDDTTINSNFATLSESLYLAERQAREEVRLRALVQKRQVEGERERRERELRELAMKARMERSGAPMASSNNDSAPVSTGPVADDGDDTPPYQPKNDDEGDVGEKPSAGDDPKANVVPGYSSSDDSGSESDGNSEDKEEAAREREKIRIERRKERIREMRMEKHRPNKREGEDNDGDGAIKKARLEDDRDVSEKIALGVHTGTGNAGGAVDGRLYNQNAGLDSGFGADDDYNTYTKPMFDRDGVSSSSIYRPTRGNAALDGDELHASLKGSMTSKFQPDKGFSGAEGGAVGGGGTRTAPVQFEKGGQK